MKSRSDQSIASVLNLVKLITTLCFFTKDGHIFRKYLIQWVRFKGHSMCNIFSIGPEKNQRKREGERGRERGGRKGKRGAGREIGEQVHTVTMDESR